MNDDKEHLYEEEEEILETVRRYESMKKKKIRFFFDVYEFENIIGGRYYLESDSLKGKDIVPSNYRHDVIIPVEIADKNHPITDGLINFEIHDEVYGNYKVLPKVHALLSTQHTESGEILAWTNAYGKSRIVYIQLGHDHYAYENPGYRRLVYQAIKWVSER